MVRAKKDIAAPARPRSTIKGAKTSMQKVLDVAAKIKRDTKQKAPSGPTQYPHVRMTGTMLPLL
jgi:hypothetical protein